MIRTRADPMATLRIADLCSMAKKMVIEDDWLYTMTPRLVWDFQHVCWDCGLERESLIVTARGCDLFFGEDYDSARFHAHFCRQPNESFDSGSS